MSSSFRSYIRLTYFLYLPNASGTGTRDHSVHVGASSPSEDYLTVLAGQRQWIATTDLAGWPGRPPDSFASSAVLTTRQSS